MKKRLMVMITLLFLALTLLLAVEKKQMERWVKIITEKDPQVKMQKLEEFHNEYGDKDDQITRLIYLHLADTAFQLKQYDKAVQYGEKAGAFKEVETSERLNLYFQLANAYFVTKNDMAKATNYANLTLETANALQGQQPKQLLELKYIAPILRLQVKILDTNGNDIKTASDQLNKALEALRIDKSDASQKILAAIAAKLEKLQQDDLALKAYEALFEVKPTATLANMIGMTYNKKGDMAKTMDYLKTSYNIKKQANVAHFLGILANKNQDLDAALNYFAEAYQLNDEKVSPKSFDILKHLYFNVKTKGMPPEQQEKGFQELLNAAKVRINEPQKISDI